MSFFKAWNAFYPDGRKAEKKAQNVYDLYVDKRVDLRGLVAHFEGLDKTGKTFEGALRGYVMGLQETAEVAPATIPAESQARPVAPSVTAPKPTPPHAAKPAERPALTRATGDDFDAAFDRIFAAWPMNSIAENAANARLAFGAAVDWYGLSFVTAKCLTAAKHIATLERKQGLKTYLTKSLAEEVKKKLAASTTEGGARRNLTDAEFEAMKAIATAAHSGELSFKTITEKCAEAGLPSPLGFVSRWSTENSWWIVSQLYGKAP